MAIRLRDELLVSRGLWEQRMLGQVTQLWGYSPFAFVLRLWHSQSTLLASLSLMRAHTTAQVALVGMVHGSRRLASNQSQRASDQRFNEIALLSLTDVELREREIVISAHVRNAHPHRPESSDISLERLRQAETSLQGEFLSDAALRIDELILQLTMRNSHWLERFDYEIVFAVLPLFLLYRVGKNFFYDTFIFDRPYLDTTFYIPAAIILVLSAGTLVMSFDRRLRRGLRQRVESLAEELAKLTIGESLFPDIEERFRVFSREQAKVDTCLKSISSIRNRFSNASELGSRKLS
jgi:hypothetical protein